eukprot:642644-Rhodomonas_salina.1
MCERGLPVKSSGDPPKLNPKILRNLQKKTQECTISSARKENSGVHEGGEKDGDREGSSLWVEGNRGLKWKWRRREQKREGGR